MKIVHVVRQYYPAVGGLENVVRELASAQAAEGHKVRVVTIDRVFGAPVGEKLQPRQSVDGVEVVRVRSYGSQRYPIAAAAIKHVGDADVVHVHAIDFFFDYFAWTKLFHRRKLIVSTHGGFFHTSYAAWLKRIYFTTITRTSLVWYDMVVAVSPADRELFGRIRGRDIVCIENGVNVSAYAQASSPTPAKSILALGRLSSNKRIDSVLCFLAALRRLDPQWRLTIAGRQWDVGVESLRELSRSLHVDGAVEIIVDPSEGAIRKLMSDCSIIASASEYEGFGVAAVEGISAGLFPVLNDIPPFRDLVTRTGIGMLVDFFDAESAAADFLEKWGKIEGEYAAVRAKAMAAALEYDWSQVSRSYAEIYDSICGASTRAILGVPILVSHASPAIALLDGRITSQCRTIVAFANKHALNIAFENERFRSILRQSVVLNDGIGVDLASLILFGKAFPQNLNGTDFVPYYLDNTRHRLRIFLLGGQSAIVDRAARLLSERFTRHQIVGHHHGFFSDGEISVINGLIKQSAANVILVAMGNPKQEIWLAENLEATGAQLGFGVGALFTFMTGEVQRAPAWMRYARIEWIHRLVQEPWRLSRRYLLGIPLFIYRVIRQRFYRSRDDKFAFSLRRSSLHRLNGKGDGQQAEL
jgi:alpha-1,3-mannosyltransferase